jgi:hypothetical protein
MNDSANRLHGLNNRIQDAGYAGIGNPEMFDKIVPSETPAKPVKPEDIVTLQTTKLMTVKETMAEMDKQGLRPMTVEEVMAGMAKKAEERIIPKDDDIVIEPSDTETPKKLEDKRSSDEK